MNNKEIRDILLGRIVRLEDKLWAAAPAGTKVPFYGARDGAVDVRLFGVTYRSDCCQTEGMEPSIAFAAAETALNSMGRPVQLRSMPERKACLYTPYWIAPVLLTLEQDGNSMWLTAYTGRSMLIGQFRCRIALWILERRLPAEITCTGKNKKPDREYAEKKKTEEKNVSKRVSKRVSPPKKKKVAPKRLKK
jgi:hypothetical protein